MSAAATAKMRAVCKLCRGILKVRAGAKRESNLRFLGARELAEEILIIAMEKKVK